MNEKAAAYKYLNEYQKKNYDRITILRKPGEIDKLTRIAKEKGYKTVTQFINACIDEKLESYNTPVQFDLLSRAPAQAPKPVPESAKPSEPDILPFTPENIAQIDFALLLSYPPYQGEVFDKFGAAGFNELVRMAEEKRANNELASPPEL